MTRSDVQEMAKKHWMDIIGVALCVSIGYFAAGRPRVDDMVLSHQKIPLPARRVQPKEAVKPENPVSAALSYTNIEKKNIFSAQKSYELLPAGVPMPEKPYDLVAVLRGNEKRAIFRSYTGSLVSRKLGEKLADGSEVVEIGDTTVSLQKGTERKEQRIFVVRSKGGK
jgi:hypothetical protein